MAKRKNKHDWWTDTCNFWVGCTKMSPACKNCYAETMERRYNRPWGADAPRRETKGPVKELLALHRVALQEGTHPRVFVGSMMDWAEDHPALPPLQRKMFGLIEEMEVIDFLMVTKRAERLQTVVPETWRAKWPDNIWLICTAENQQYFDERWAYLKDIPVNIRGLSMEPMLGPISLPESGTQPDWVIVGGESGVGKHIRPTHPSWVRRMIDQCRERSIPVWFKQWGQCLPCEYDRALEAVDINGRVHDLTKVGTDVMIEPSPFRRIMPKAKEFGLDGKVYMELPQTPWRDKAAATQLVNA